MKLPSAMPAFEAISDADLVSACLQGDRHAFRQIVERYQRLLCSLAYSATGRLSQSEDLAQDAFVEAWRALPRLREPEKLRSWLCGILRFKVSHLRRADGRQPVSQASSLESALEVESDDLPAPDLAIHAEEQGILWNALGQVPELYREPLILYYREHKSVEHVAVALDLTEDTVKQRLARGRKILQEQVLTFVEGALSRSSPGNVFTIGVLAALPQIAAPAKVAGWGTAAAHGGMLAKTTGLAAVLAMISGLISGVLTLRANLDQARTPRERRAVVKITIGAFASAFIFLGIIYALRNASYRWWEHRQLFAVITQVLVVAGIFGWSKFILGVMRYQRQLRTRERLEHPELFTSSVDRKGSSAGEYKSRLHVFGVPFVHVRFSSPDDGEPPAFGWFAGGDRAYGLLMAWGGYAVAPISVGAVSIGVFAMGTVGVGVVSIGTIGVGVLTIGCASIGYHAMAWLSALGWASAQGGGFALAHTAAQGPIAFATHANDAVAQALLSNSHGSRIQLIVYILSSLVSLFPVIYYARAVRKRLGRQARIEASGS